MPQGKPPGAPGGASAKLHTAGSSSSASGQIIAGQAYPPSLPPIPPKAKATATPLQQFYMGDKEETPSTPSPPKWPYSTPDLSVRGFINVYIVL